MKLDYVTSIVKITEYCKPIFIYSTSYSIRLFAFFTFYFYPKKLRIYPLKNIHQTFCNIEPTSMNIHQILNFVNVISSNSNTNVDIRGGLSNSIQFQSLINISILVTQKGRYRDGIESKYTGFNLVAKLQRFCRDETSMPLRDFSQDSAQTVSCRIPFQPYPSLRKKEIRQKGLMVDVAE